MAKLPRILQKIFGDDGPTTQFGQIGSDNAGTPTTTKNLDTIQSLQYYLDGLFAITNNVIEPPRAEDFNSLHFLTTAQLKYIFQSGIPEWITTEDYYANVSIVQVAGNIYLSLTGTDPTPNTGNDPTSSPTDWKLVLSTDGALNPTNNLSDVVSAATSRTNLDVYGKSETYTQAEVDALITSSTALTAIGTAAEAITEGDPVGVLDDGEVRKSGTTLLFDNFTVTSGFDATDGSIVWLSEDVFIVVYVKSTDIKLYARVGQYVDGAGAPTWLCSETAVQTSANTVVIDNAVSVSHITGDQFVIGWIENDTNDEPAFRVGTYLGGSISWDTTVSVLTPGGDSTELATRVFDSTNARFIAGFLEGTTIKTVIGTYSTGSLSFTSIVNYSALTYAHVSVAGDTRTDSFAILGQKTTGTTFAEITIRFGQYLTGAVNYLTTEFLISNRGKTSPGSYNQISMNYTREEQVIIQHGFMVALAEYDGAGNTVNVQTYDGLVNAQKSPLALTLCTVNDTTVCFVTQEQSTYIHSAHFKILSRSFMILQPYQNINATNSFDSLSFCTPMAQKGRTLVFSEYYGGSNMRLNGIRFVNCDGIAMDTVAAAASLQYMIKGVFTTTAGTRVNTDYYINFDMDASELFTTERKKHIIGHGISDTQIDVDVNERFKAYNRAVMNSAGLNRAPNELNNYSGGNLRLYAYPIGGWDMDTSSAKDVYIDIIGSLTSVLFITAIILPDPDVESLYPTSLNLPDSTRTLRGAITMTGTGMVTLVREAASFYDSTDYNDSTVNRGFVYIVALDLEVDQVMP